MQGMPSPAYDWNDLKYFLACARLGSLSKAGRHLKVDQTTVSRRLTALEAALGAKLVDRTAPRTLLSPAGEALLLTAQRLEQTALDLGGMASGRDARTEGLVRLATTETLSVTWLARQLPLLQARHPGLARRTDDVSRAGYVDPVEGLGPRFDDDANQVNDGIRSSDQRAERRLLIETTDHDLYPAIT